MPSPGRGPDSIATLAALRRVRRRRRTENVDRFETLYQAYLAALLSVAAVLVASDLVGDQRSSLGQLTLVGENGSAVVGLAGAVVVYAALRSGGQGGPLSVEPPDVLHLMMAPVDRRLALRPAVYARLRSSVAVTAGVAAAAGVVAGRRLPGGTPVWVATAGLAGLGVGLLSVGAAMIVSGLRWPRSWAAIVGTGLVGWSLADWALHIRTSPLTLLGALALWPVTAPPVHAAAAPLVAVLAAAMGVTLAGGLSLEAAERRAALVSQLRFAATLRDLRTVVLLRRRLAQEQPRRHPWIRLNPGTRTIGAAWKRDWEGLLRWPTSRIVRVLLLSTAAGLALRETWAGTTPLLLVAGVALWLVALDAVEGLGQEVDHPGLADLLPVGPGRLMLGHLPAAATVTALAAVPAILAAMPKADVRLVSGIGMATLLPGALCAVGAATLSTARKAVDPADPGSVATPETAGIRMVVRECLPPAVATAGLLPVVVAREAAKSGAPAIPAALSAWAVLALPLGVAVWLSYRDLQ